MSKVEEQKKLIDTLRRARSLRPWAHCSHVNAAFNTRTTPALSPRHQAIPAGYSTRSKGGAHTLLRCYGPAWTPTNG
eukprot:scaffold38859_cov28-Tisochrysis_lutea.AAC.3